MMDLPTLPESYISLYEGTFLDGRVRLATKDGSKPKITVHFDFISSSHTLTGEIGFNTKHPDYNEDTLAAKCYDVIVAYYMRCIQDDIANGSIHLQ